LIAFGLVWALAGAAPAPALAPEEVAIYLMEVPPLTMNLPERKGLVGDMVFEAIRRAGYVPRVIVVPSNRALAMVASPDMRDALIIPLARVEEREARYTWIAPIARVNRAFFSLSPSVASFGEARASYRQVGVARGTAGVGILRRQGFSERQVYEINQGEGALRMLLLGRIDAWYGPVAEGKALLKSIDTGHRANASALLGPTFNYLGCSRVCDPLLVARLTRALKAMDSDGSSRAIRQKYGDIE
jgi:polar amino acid transport system substrate-binding protein